MAKLDFIYECSYCGTEVKKTVASPNVAIGQRFVAYATLQIVRRNNSHSYTDDTMDANRLGRGDGVGARINRLDIVWTAADSFQIVRDRTFGPGNAMERLFFFQHLQRRVRGNGNEDSEAVQSIKATLAEHAVEPEPTASPSGNLKWPLCAPI